MSRQELAEALNAYLWDTYKQEENLDENDIGKLESGRTRWPGERRREAFRAVLHATTDAELGFYINRRTRSPDATPTTAGGEATSSGMKAVSDAELGSSTALDRATTGVEQASSVDAVHNGFVTGIAGPSGYSYSEPEPGSPLNWRMSRRDVFRCVCGGLIAAGLLRMCDRCGRVQRVVQALDVVLSTSDDKVGLAADSLDELVSHYAQTVCTVPPTSVYDELFSVRSYAGSLLDRVGPCERRRTDLVLAAGWLSSLLAVVTCDMGDHAAALLWCSDAERRSREADHLEIAAWATLTRVMIAFYQGRAGRAVALAGRGQRIAPVGTVAYAKLAAQEMRAWALLGKLDEMAQAKRRAAGAIARLPSGVSTTGAFSINLAEDPPYTATSLLLVNRFQEAVLATNRVIETVYRPEASSRSEMPSSYARSLMILALGHAGLGQADKAVAAGCAALDSAPLVWPTIVLAGKLDQTLMRGFAGVTDVADYHARYIDAASRTEARRQLAAQPEDRG